MRCLLPNTMLLLASAAAVSSDTASNSMDDHAQNMVAWLRDQEGGYFNEKLQIRRADPSDPASYFGVFATESIPSMEPLMSVPASSMIRSIQQEYHTWEEYHEVLCDLTHVLLKELKLGEESYFAPYVKYLLGQERGQIPATWTEPAKELLREVFDPSGDKMQVTDWIESFEHEDCIEPGNAFEQQALAMVIQRGWDVVLIPIYDLHNHMNDVEKLNTDNNSVHSTEGLRVWASKPIEAGEELFITYDNCSDCQSNPEHWGTTELFKDFGFVELYPRKFNFWVGEEQILFAIDEVTNGEDSHYLELEWLKYGSPPSYEGIAGMKEEYQRLQDLQHEGTLAERRHLMPEKEWNTIFQFQQALTVALGAASIQAAIERDLEEDADDGDDGIDDDDNITFASIKDANEHDYIDEVDDITNNRGSMDAHAQNMVAWLRDQEGGYFNEKLQIRRADPSDPASYFGVFATESIPSMEPLMSVPASSMIRSIQQEYHTWEEYHEVLCDLTHVLLKELKLGEKSYFAPYVKYLLGQERNQIPATWTEPAKELLREVFDPSGDKIQVTDWIESFEHEDCIEPGNAFEQQALAMVIQRGWDIVLIPIYDLHNHMNDVEKLNTDNNSVHSTEGLRVWASKPIEAGEELFITYDNCNDCQDNPEHWGTSELLQDFGFVELYPRKFNFWVGEEQILFVIDEATNEDDGEDSHHLELEWLKYGSPPSYEGIAGMKEEYQRLQDLQHEGTLAERRHLMPEKEWNTTFQFQQALTEALEAAIQAASEHDLEEDADDGDDDIDEDDNITFGSVEDADKDDYIDEVDDITDDRENKNIDEVCTFTTL